MEYAGLNCFAMKSDGQFLEWVFESTVCRQMLKKLENYKTLTDHEKKKAARPKLTARRAKLAWVESEIEKLLDMLMGAPSVLISSGNAKIEELDSRLQVLASEIAKLSAGITGARDCPCAAELVETALGTPG